MTHSPASTLRFRITSTRTCVKTTRREKRGRFELKRKAERGGEKTPTSDKNRTLTKAHEEQQVNAGRSHRGYLSVGLLRKTIVAQQQEPGPSEHGKIDRTMDSKTTANFLQQCPALPGTGAPTMAVSCQTVVECVSWQRQYARKWFFRQTTKESRKPCIYHHTVRLAFVSSIQEDIDLNTQCTCDKNNVQYRPTLFCLSVVCSNKKLVLMACSMQARSSSDLGTT